MIGDDIVSDVGGAQACGIRGVQVRTGKYRQVVDVVHFLCILYKLNFLSEFAYKFLPKT